MTAAARAALFGMALAIFVGSQLSASAAGNVSMIASSTCGTQSGFCFSPKTLTVPAGSAVTWTNSSSAPHTATSDNSAWTTPVVLGGQSASITFSSPGSFPYHCRIHPDMMGTITVTAAATATPMPTAVPTARPASRLARTGAAPVELVPVALGGAAVILGLILMNRRRSVKL